MKLMMTLKHVKTKTTLKFIQVIYILNILLRVLDQVEGFPSNATLFQFFFKYFIKIIRYMFPSYDHLQVGICTLEINMTGLFV
jgi:hypothetical protein